MPMTAILILVLVTPAPAPAAFSDALEPDAIVAVMTATADWQLAHPSKHPPYDWTQAALLHRLKRIRTAFRKA